MVVAEEQARVPEAPEAPRPFRVAALAGLAVASVASVAIRWAVVAVRAGADLPDLHLPGLVVARPSEDLLQPAAVQPAVAVVARRTARS